jgi:carbon-monoxide dehydrogenase iron sulfur subunit
MKKMKIIVDKSKCTGCLLCEITCSLFHCGQIQRKASAIQIQLSDLDLGLHRPVLCRQCKKMSCLKSEGKDSDDQLKRAFFWENDPARQKDCAFNALFAFNDKLIHCDLCQGDPECVKSCPTGALSTGS